MNHSLLFAAGFAGAGLALLAFGFRKTAGALFAKGTFLMLVLLPSRPLHALERVNPGLRRWVHPRLPLLQRDWLAFAALWSVGVGLAVAFGRKRSGRKPEWDAPKEMWGLDSALGRRLDGQTRRTGTFLGMASGRREVCLADTRRERHMQIVGPTRSGKSQLLFALSGQDMRAGMPVFFM
ncbi:MAG: hypothetical protein KGL53_15305, partial [Elusimicrobia bacterium]|nr:hypothetical protein [Elusimicrobiota bacterium]